MYKIALLIILVAILYDVREIKLTIRQTELRATTAQEMVKYWLPPIRDTRLKNNCGRCHK